MKKYKRAYSLTGALLCATAVSAQQTQPAASNPAGQSWDPYMSTLQQDRMLSPDDTPRSRVSASARFGFNIKGKFTGVGSAFTSGAPFGAGQTTPDGAPYNYDDGYVLTDISGNAGGMTTYWGFNSANQVNGDANTVSLNRTVATGVPGQSPQDDSARTGVEVTYNYEIGVIENWHGMRYGIEGAVNFMPIEFNTSINSPVSLSTVTDTYLTENSPQDLIDNAPYQGTFGGPGYLLDVPALPSEAQPSVSDATFIAQQHFDANLWGFRLGPYVEWPMADKFSLHVSGGLAVGIVDANASWNETLTPSGGLPTLHANGSGSDCGVLYGGYVGADAIYQFNKRWSVDVGVQFQDLGTYRHDFGGCAAELDLSQSVFVQAGVSYSF